MYVFTHLLTQNLVLTLVRQWFAAEVWPGAFSSVGDTDFPSN